MSKDQQERNQTLVDLLKQKCDELNLKDSNRTNNVQSVAAAREFMFNEQLEKSLERIFKNKIIIPNYKTQNKGKINRTVNLVLSDLHFGSDLDPQEVPLAYGKIEETRRFASICKQTADYKPQYRTETTLNIFLLGDLIQGKLHDVQAAAGLREQCARTMRLLVEGIAFLCTQFPRGVNVYTQPGNHGRFTERHRERPVNEKHDALENVIYDAVKLALNKIPNLKFTIPKTPYVTVDIFDKRVFLSHGDTVVKVPFPGSNINVKSIKNQMNEINATMGKDGKEFSLFVFGHVHTNAIIRLSNSILMLNGCLIPPDPFALSIGIFESDCGQQLFESVPGHIVGDSRYLQVDSNTDKDSSLDKIIKPFERF